jgi:hypothetical protein
MRQFINAMLAFALAVFVGRIVPVSAQHLAELRTIQAQIAASRETPAAQLRLSSLR